MFQKVFEYAGPHKKGLYAATAIVLVSVLLGVFPFVLAYQVIAPLVMGEAITASFIIQHVILVLVCLVLQALFYGWGLNLSHKAAYDTLLRLRTALQKRFEKLPLGVIQDKGTGTVKKLFVDDVDSLEVLLAHSMPDGIANLMVPIATITHLLDQQEYCGDVLNFKTYSKSYKNKKRIHNDPENWVVFQNVHEPIIERAVFEQVQQKRGKMRKRRTSNGEHNMFSGLLVCADCGCNLHFHFNQGNPEIKYFNCSNYKGNRGTCQSTHYIRVDFLEEVVLGEIRRLTKFASLYEDDFLKAVIGHSQQADEADRKLKEKELKALLARDEELDGLFERIYEDNVSGKISDERFSRMSRRYEDEQKELTEKIKQLRSEIEKQSSRTMTTDMFISLVRKYTRAKKLTPRMLNELVEKIEVFNAEKVNGVWEQRLRIHYNCVGTIEIPSALPLPTPDVSVNTRKGVVVNYAPCDVAI